MSKKARGRPPNLAARQQVLKAARTLMEEGGVAAVTIEELSARTGVTRPTIYRSWPNAKSVAMAALMANTSTKPVVVLGRSAAKDLTRVLEGVIAVFGTPMGRSAASLVTSADQSTELAKAFRHQVLLQTREKIAEVISRAIEAGDLRRGIDLEVAADLVLAPVFFRLLVGHQPLSKSFAETLVQHVLDGLRDED